MENFNLSTLAEQIVSTEHQRPIGRSFIQAIKLFRALSGCDLLTAKKYCDNAVRDLGLAVARQEDCSHCAGKGFTTIYTRDW